MMTKKYFSLLIGLLLCAGSAEVIAAGTAGCTVTTNTLSFGNYDTFSNSPLSSSGSIDVKCSPSSTSYTVTLDNGLYGSIINRKMRNGNSSDALSYNLYTDPSFSTIWGNNTGGGVVVTGNRINKFTVYARIPALQDVSVGGYADSVTVDVIF